MTRKNGPSLLLVLALGLTASCAPGRATSAPAPAQDPGAAAGSDTSGRRPGGARPRPYDQVITREAITREGLFKTHRIGDRLFFEIPRSELRKEMLVLARTVAGGSSTGFFGGGPSMVVRWERDGNRVLLRRMTHSIASDSAAAIALAVERMREGPILASFNVESFGPDSATVVDVTRAFTSDIPGFSAVNDVAADRSFVEEAFAFPENVNVEVTQSGTLPPPPNAPRGQPGTRPQPVTARVLYSMLKLPEDPMRPRLHDRRVGLGSVVFVDYSRPEHRAEQRRLIRRFRLECPAGQTIPCEPRERIVFWIDPATPEWLLPWVEKGVDDWRVAYEEAGFRNAIEARRAPTPAEDPTFSMYDARYNVIYWRPSDVPNATGGQLVDPRTGEILKAEVNMYHNVMNLLRNWYFIQVSPLDPRAQTLPLPDSLMGRLVEYVVAHEIGHAIGFPHNMKASSQFPADSIRSASFLRRMGGHVATLMDYSRFNYVAQPEDSIPVDLLIPGVGPYDKFAIMWQNRPIPGADTPDEERAVLDQWARMQDTIPWFRFSTSDATGDPYNLTEAVGDEDAVKSSRLGLRNLERVVASLLRAAERPGEDYSLLEELYTNAVQQWGRYNGHVAAIVGGAQSQERYGTGIRFMPVAEARQREAVRFLAENAFRVPRYFLDPEILRRIEQEGLIPRFRTAQANVLNTLLAESRLNRMIENEALAEGGEAYTVAELLGDLRGAVWSEVISGTPRVDVYRRNLQRAYLEAVDRQLNPPVRPDAPTPDPDEDEPGRRRYAGDVRPLLRGELIELDRIVGAAIGRTRDPMTRLHLQDVRFQIGKILDPEDD